MGGESGFNTVAVVGLGYVGLPAAVAFAKHGLRVVGVDVDPGKVEAVNSGECYLDEPALCRELEAQVSAGRLRATTDYDEAAGVDAFVVAVPTPVERGEADLSYLTAALEAIAPRLRRGVLVSIESTVPPGTTSGLARGVLEAGSGLRAEEDFYLAHVPERLAPGRSLEELEGVPRVVGGVGPRSTEAAVSLYSRVNPRLIPVTSVEAELVKLAENSYRDLNIAFANMLALAAERLGVDVWRVIRAANTHPRVNIHSPGAGVGGPCLTKDPYMLARAASGLPGAELLTIARMVNDYMPRHTVNLVVRALRDAGARVGGSTVAVLGAAYKGGVGDTRASPAEAVVRLLLGMGARVRVYDPYTREAFGAEAVGSLEEALEGADAAVVVTDHPEFRSADWRRLARLMRRPILVDGRRVLEPEEARAAGLRYYGVGYGGSTGA